MNKKQLFFWRHWKCKTVAWSSEEKHMDEGDFFTYHIFVLLILLRHSPHSTSLRIKLEMKVLSSWLKHWNRTKWVGHSHRLSHLHLSHYTQTLNLCMNRIGDEGAKQLGEALKQNKVSRSLSSTLSSSSFSLHTDTHHTRPPLESNWSRRC